MAMNEPDIVTINDQKKLPCTLSALCCTLQGSIDGGEGGIRTHGAGLPHA
jgi:hypothetical protein